jgi:Ca2+/Na+ antiporter
MNSLTALLEQFSLPDLTRVLRRTALSALVAAGVGLVVSAALGSAVFGWGLVIGLGLGLANIRLVTLQTARVSKSKIAKPIRALASLTLARLGATTIVVIALAVLVTALGLGAVAGIAIFYGVFLVNLIVSVVRHRGAEA